MANLPPKLLWVHHTLSLMCMIQEAIKEAAWRGCFVVGNADLLRYDVLELNGQDYDSLP